jgi:DNA-3-methyladenine glycosylase
MIVEKDFYLRNDVVQIGQELLGTVLYTRIDNKVTSGIIVETEAYCGSIDRASHAYPSRLTNRNKIMFEAGGRAYVYLIYGIHYLFNIVTNKSNMADAVLIRAIEPVSGKDIMMKRRAKNSIERITSGPGILSEAMGIDKSLYGEDLTGNKIWLEYAPKKSKNMKITKTTRIGVDYAGDDAKLPWRFYIKDNPWISKP